MKIRPLVTLAALGALAAAGTALALHPRPAPAGGRPGSSVLSARPAPPGTALPGTAAAGPPGPGWRLALGARFAGSRLDTSLWATCYPWADTAAGCTNFGNTEYEWYQPGQVRVHGGLLHLVAQRLPTGGQTAHGQPRQYQCRSGMVTSYPGFRFQYGLVQVVARFPASPGLWSVLWLAPADQRPRPEIDILERWEPPDPRTGMYFHPVNAPRLLANPVIAGLSASWHTFTLEWSPGRLTWAVDGRRWLSATSHIPHQPMYFLADLADYTLAPAHACDGELTIRSVRIWQRRVS